LHFGDQFASGVTEAGEWTGSCTRPWQNLEIGDSLLIKEGVVGVVLARFIPPGRRNEVHYIVELRPDEADKGRP